MSSIIRAAEYCRGSQSVAFNFEDMAGKAGQYLDQVRAEAAKILAEAKKEAEAIRKQAEQAGRAAGEQAGRAAIEQIVQKQLSTVLPALRKVTQEIQHAKQAWLKHWEASGVHVAAAIAAKIIRREISQQPEITLTLVREAMELAAGNSQVRIHLNPDDHRAIAGQVDLLCKELSTLTTAEVVADQGVTRGGCRVETEFGTIDQQIESQLKRIEEELG